MKVLVCGPFIGDFEREILTFRPYCRWLQEVIDHDVMYISSHSNRSFLYDFIPEDNFLPVYDNLSREETDQKGYINKQVIQKDYNLFVRNLKDNVMDRESCNRKSVIHYTLNYIKSTPPYPIYNKIFESVVIPDIEISESNGRRVVLIPHKAETEERIGRVFEHLRDNHNCLIIGDMNTHMPYINKILRYPDIFENCWKYMFAYMKDAKAVICPVSFWTAICNFQGFPVFSWGEGVSLYKNGGMYDFNNKKSMVIPSDKDTEPEIIIRSLKYFLERL